MVVFREEGGMEGRKEETMPSTFSCWYSSREEDLLDWSKKGRRMVTSVRRVSGETPSTLSVGEGGGVRI